MATGVYLAKTISPKLTASAATCPRESRSEKQNPMNTQVRPSSSPSALQDPAVNRAMGEMARVMRMGKNRFAARKAT